MLIWIAGNNYLCENRFIIFFFLHFLQLASFRTREAELEHENSVVHYFTVC